jgi:galactokinase
MTTAHSGTAGSGTARWYGQPDEATAAERVVRAFESAYGRAPDGVWAAPGRLNLIGEHVDYNAGRCLPLALPERTFVALALRPDGLVRAHSPNLRGRDQQGRAGDEPDGARWEGALADVGPGRVPGWAGYVAGVPWALQRAGHAVRGFDAEIDSYVPVASGLSSSAALECAVVLALDDLLGFGLAADDDGRSRLAAACVDAENLIAGAPTGGLDQAASLRCRAGHALALDCRDFSTRQVPLDPAAAGLQLLVIDTRASHAHADGKYGSRREACQDACRLLGVPTLRDVATADLDDALTRLGHLAGTARPEAAAELQRRVRHVVTEIDRVGEVVTLLDAGRVADIAPLLDASHASLRDDFEVSCAELDLACDAARAAGALGARMTGGGFGGSAVALVASADADRVASAVAAAFAAAGFAPPAFGRATPSGPGARVA